MQTRGLFHRLDTKYRPLEKLNGDGDRTMLTCTYVYVLLYEGKCKWSYGPSYHVDFPLNIFIHSFNQVHVRPVSLKHDGTDGTDGTVKSVNTDGTASERADGTDGTDVK